MENVNKAAAALHPPWFCSMQLDGILEDGLVATPTKAGSSNAVSSAMLLVPSNLPSASLEIERGTGAWQRMELTVKYLTLPGVHHDTAAARLVEGLRGSL